MNAAAYLLGADVPGHHPVLVGHSREYTYQELRQGVEAVASFLIREGANEGDRVLLQANNSFFWMAVYLGTIRAGCVCVPVPPTLESAELEPILSSTSPRFLFLRSKCRPAATDCHATAIVVDEPCSLQSQSRIDARPFDDVLADATSVAYSEVDERTALAALMFTSGSTGVPRGVMVSHRNIIANTESIIQFLGLRAADRVMAVLPFYYCFGTSLLHTHLRVGASMVVDESFLFANKVLTRMRESRCTGFAGVPSHYQILLRKSALRSTPLPDLRWAQQAGGNFPAVFIREWRECVPNARLFVMYGQTEATARLAYLPPECLDTKTGSIGKAIPGVTLHVVDDVGTPVRPGDIGEIVAEGDNVTLGYWAAPAETQTTFINGALKTGDIGTVDEDGFIYIVDRAKDFIKCGGTRVACQRIENVLLAMDELIEAAVLGVPDEMLGEAVKAFVVARNSDSAIVDRVRRHCAQRLPPALVPRDVVVLESLPKNDAGKILKSAFRSSRHTPRTTIAAARAQSLRGSA